MTTIMKMTVTAMMLRPLLWLHYCRASPKSWCASSKGSFLFNQLIENHARTNLRLTAFCGRQSMMAVFPSSRETFVVSNPHLPDTPLTHVSDGFLEVRCLPSTFARARCIRHPATSNTAGLSGR